MGSTLIEDFLSLRRDFILYVGACGAIRLFLGASLCTYYLALDVFFFFGLYMVGGDTLRYFVIYISCFTAY